MFPSSQHVVLITNRPSVCAFFQEHAQRIGADLSFKLIPLTQECIAPHHDQLRAAAVAIVDIGSDPDTGVRTCEALRAGWPGLRILAIVCCWQPTLAWHIQQLMASRVDEVLDARADPTDIFGALQGDHDASLRVHLRGRYEQMQSVERTLDTDQRRLLELVARGWTDNELGDDFSVSARTIRGRLERLRDVLGARNREELAAWAGAHGLYEAPALPRAVTGIA